MILAAGILIYRLVNGTRSVQEIIEVSLLGKFATLEILASLLEGGDIKEVGIKSAVASSQKGPTFQVLKQRTMFVGYAVALGFALILLVVSFYPFNLGFLWGTPEGGISSTRGYVAEVRRERVEWAKKIFFLERGRYPENLRELVDAGILTENDLTE